MTDYSANASGDAEYVGRLDGLLARESDFSEGDDASRRLAGTLALLIAGAENFIPPVNPLTVVPGSGLQVTVGGAGQMFVCQKRLVLYAPAQSIGLSAADGTNPRHDLIVVKYSQNQDNANPITERAIRSGGSTTLHNTIHRLVEGCTFAYVAGVPAGSPVDPAVPAGYVALARVTVAAGATTLSSGNITLLFPTYQQLLAGLLPSLVNSLDAKTGALLLEGHDGLVVDDAVDAHQIHLRLPGANNLVNVPYRVTYLAGGGYPSPGTGTDMGVTVSPNGGINVSMETVSNAVFAIGFRTILDVIEDFNVTIWGIGIQAADVYLNGSLVGSIAGLNGGITFSIPAGTGRIIDIVYHSRSLGDAFYLGSEGVADPQGGSLTVFGWLNDAAAVVSAVRPGTIGTIAPGGVGDVPTDPPTSGGGTPPGGGSGHTVLPA